MFWAARALHWSSQRVYNLGRKVWVIFWNLIVLGIDPLQLLDLQRGIPSKRESSARVDYVPALCTHRPSLLPIEWLSEAFGLDFGSWQQQLETEKLIQTWSFRGSKSRNKVSVGEPAEGSFIISVLLHFLKIIFTLCAMFVGEESFFWRQTIYTNLLFWTTFVWKILWILNSKYNF